LPEPEGPRRVKNSPSSITRSTPATATTPP
jgi:hypothetical protein